MSEPQIVSLQNLTESDLAHMWVIDLLSSILKNGNRKHYMAPYIVDSIIKYSTELSNIERTKTEIERQNAAKLSQFEKPASSTKDYILAYATRICKAETVWVIGTLVELFKNIEDTLENDEQVRMIQQIVKHCDYFLKD